MLSEFPLSSTTSSVGMSADTAGTSARATFRFDRVAQTLSVPRPDSSGRKTILLMPNLRTSQAPRRVAAPQKPLLERVPHPCRHYIFMSSTRRRLPHIYPEGQWLFVTWHLHGSLPRGKYPPPGKASAGKAFVWMDRYLDHASTGPLFLRQPALAKLVGQSLRKGVALGHYNLGAFVVMANHVHVLLQPHIAPSRLLQSLKGFTAREANRLLGHTGEPFWQAESYDHWVRNQQEYERIAAYIESNPVKAGLVECAEDYLWSSAHQRKCLDTIVETADTSVRATLMDRS